MKFRVGETHDEPKAVASMKTATQGVFVQSQAKDGDPMAPAFGLSWRLDYADGHSVQSEWTPMLAPSIRRSLAARPDAELLTVFGRNRAGSFELELARIDYAHVKGFGYIAEQRMSRPGLETILGIFIELNAKTIKVWRNGFVQEILK